MKLLALPFILLFLNFNLMSQHLMSPPNAARKEVKLIKSILKDYVNDEEALLIYNPYAPLYFGIYGITYQYTPNMCLISISASIADRDKRYYVILHELGHVLDIFYGDLSEYPPMWKGKRMDHTLDWNERPWEIHADEWANRLWKKYLPGDPPPNDLFDNVSFPHDCIFQRWGSIKFKSE